jgi:hypothetical protein
MVRRRVQGPYEASKWVQSARGRESGSGNTFLCCFHQNRSFRKFGIGGLCKQKGRWPRKHTSIFSPPSWFTTLSTLPLLPHRYFSPSYNPSTSILCRTATIPNRLTISSSSNISLFLTCVCLNVLSPSNLLIIYHYLILLRKLHPRSN